jgi:D-alanyl-lipoteichoic acid acyltransferase DltB (MBOAT superfamily)
VLFNSIDYVLFFPVAVLAYFLAPRPVKPYVLVAASYTFYSSWNVAFLPLIIGLTIVNYFAGLLVASARDAGAERRMKWVLGIGIAINVATLGFFKYSLFFATAFANTIGLAGVDMADPSFEILLPLAISFFVFEFISYLMDVKRGGPPVRSPIRFACFAAFFPTQIAGPIKRYQDFLPQLLEARKFDRTEAAEGARLFVIGLFKKIALADNIAPAVTAGFTAATGPGLSAGDAWLVMLGFAMQVYFDFSAYTDMGRGSALILGFRVPINFRRPYLARNIADLWHRWHISLSTWLRDYLYIPMGGNRRHQGRNLFLTMCIGGLWHGSGYNFIVWGAYQGTLLAVYARVRKWRPLGGAVGRLFRWSAPVTGVAFTFLLTVLGYVLFRASNLSHAIDMYQAMLGLAPSRDVISGMMGWFIVATAVGTIGLEIFVERWLRVSGAPAEPEPGAGAPLPARIPRRTGPAPAAALAARIAPAPAALRVAWPVICAVALVAAIVMQPPSGPRFVYFDF